MLQSVRNEQHYRVEVLYIHKECKCRAPVRYVNIKVNVVILQYDDMLQTVWNELDYRVDVCIISNGTHIEQL
jgi:hypothetical protein